jgi:hypothetical protein
MSATPQLRPLRVGEVLDAAIKVYTRNAGQLFKTVLIVVIPFEIIGAILLSSTVSGSSIHNGKFLFTSQSDLDAFNVSRLVLSVLIGLLVLLANAACFKAVSDTYLGERPNWRESLSFAFRRFGPVLWLSIIAFVILVVAFICLILPGIYFAVAFSVALPVLLVERIGGFKALGRSVDLVRGRWWPTLGTLLVAAILVAVIQFVIGIIIGIVLGIVFHGSGGSPVLAVVLGRLLDGVSRMVSIPFYAAAITVIYYDLRVRKEGYDLQLLAEGIGRSAPSPAAPAAPPPGSPVAAPEGLSSGQEPTGLERPGGSAPPPPPSG